MFQTWLTDTLGIRYPIIQDGMGTYGTAKLAAAVTNAGGLGTLSQPGMAIDDVEIRRRVRAGAFPGAFKDDHGHWRIPLGDIEAAVSGVFGANRTSADLTALEIGLRSKPDPKPRRIFSGGPSSGWGSKLTELQRLARERDERA